MEDNIKNIVSKAINKDEYKNLSYEKRIEKFLQESSLFSDDYFIIFMQDEENKNDIAEYMLRLFTGKKNLKITGPPELQKEIKNPGGRTAVLDFTAIEIIIEKVFNSKTNTIEEKIIVKRYNIEIQRLPDGASPERARFYSSSFDGISITASQDFKEISENFTIFFTETDYFGKGQPIYCIDRFVEIKDDAGNVTERIPFNDRSHIIYINGAYDDTTTELGRLIHDFHCTKYDDMLCPVIKERSEYLKSEGGRKYMFKLFAEDIEKAREEERKKAEIEIEKAKKEAEIEIKNAKKEAKEAEKARKAEEKARKQAVKQAKQAETQAKQAEKQAKQAKQQGKLEGMAEAIINNIKSLMQNLNMTAENAIKALNLPPEKHEFYLAQLQNT